MPAAEKMNIDPETFDWKDLPFLQSKDYSSIMDLYQKLTICPSKENVLRAFELTPYRETRVIILGQDPYPNPRYACGVAFSIPRECTSKPPTLANILKELHDDLGHAIPKHGDLTKWTRQGVLLLNTALTCKAWESRSHQYVWAGFVNEVIKALAPKPVVYVLWGQSAKDYEYVITRDCKASTVLTAAHPSPYSAQRGFFGTKPFSSINSQLAKFPDGLNAPIDWDLNRE